MKNAKEDCEMKDVKDIKIFLKQNKTRDEKKAQERYKNFAEEEKEKKSSKNLSEENRGSQLSIEEIELNT